MLVQASEEVLFKFQYQKPQFKPLSQLPPNMSKKLIPKCKGRAADTSNPFFVFRHNYTIYFKTK